MDPQFSHCAGKLAGTRSATPTISVKPAWGGHGFVATASDDDCNILTCWGPSADDARMRVEALWFGIA